jgi:hypothetical protein
MFFVPIWYGSSHVLLLESKQELIFGTYVLVIEKTLQDKLYIKCPMSPLSRLDDLMVDMLE